MSTVRWALGIAGLMMAGALSIFGIAVSSYTPVSLDAPLVSEPSSTPTWIERVTLVDEAIDQSDLRRAMYEWREAYGAAVGSRRWEAMAGVGERAVRISELGGNSQEFRAEARKAYRNALFRARAERSVEGVRRMADAFESLGDADVAAEARRMAADLSTPAASDRRRLGPGEASTGAKLMPSR